MDPEYSRIVIADVVLPNRHVPAELAILDMNMMAVGSYGEERDAVECSARKRWTETSQGLEKQRWSTNSVGGKAELRFLRSTLPSCIELSLKQKNSKAECFDTCPAVAVICTACKDLSTCF